MPGGSFLTEISEGGADFALHFAGCFLAVTDRELHEELGFYDGWGTVTRQLAELVEDRTESPR